MGVVSLHAEPPTTTRALSVHADYACRQTGACCRAGWTVPVDAATKTTLAQAIADGRLTSAAGPAAFVSIDNGDERWAFEHDAAGRCVFLRDEPTTCACRVHEQLGPHVLPTTCRQFPRIARIASDVVDITLSHACPTAAALLVDADGPLAIVEQPRCALGQRWDGLDTRGHVPPWLRPGVAHTTTSWQEVERASVALCEDDRPAEDILATFALWADLTARWSPPAAFDAHLVDVLSQRATSAADERRPSVLIECWHAVRSTVPAARSTVAAAPAGWAMLVAVEACAHAWRTSVRRYLAAHAFASWVPWFATHMAAWPASLRLVHAVLIVELARLVERRSTADVDRATVIEALRAADLLVRHLIDDAAFVRLADARSPRRERR